MKHVYYISGFGADDRVFSNLDQSRHHFHYIPWQIPGKNETIESYSYKLLAAIQHPRPILMGLSFGGMMSIEISKYLSLEKVILISSIKTRSELPLYMKMAAKLKLNKIFPLKPSPLLEPLENYNLGIKTEEEKLLVREYRKNIDPVYTEWAIDQIINWKNEWIPQHITHIHGAADRIFPVKNLHPDYTIPDAGHLMIMNHADEINAILKSELDS